MPPPSQNYSQRRTGYNSRYDEDGYRRTGYNSRYDEDGYRRDGRRKIEGYKQSQGPVRTYGGLNEYYALQDRNNRAFSDPRFPGKSAGEISQNAQATNKQINKYGQAEDAYQNRFSQWEQGQRQENIRKAKADGSFARKRTEYNKANMGKREMLTDGFILGDDGGRDQYTSINFADRERIDPNWGLTYDGESAEEINAKDAAEAKKKKDAEPKTTMVEGKLPNEDHSSPLEGAELDTLASKAWPQSKFAPVTPRQMYRDAASQRSIIARDDGSAEITSKYGSGSSTPRTASTPPATVKDDFGNIVPMKDYAERRKYVRDTQVGYKPSRRA